MIHRLMTKQTSSPLKTNTNDLSVLELINLITVGVASYNFKNHMASDIGIDQLYIPSEKIKSQSYMDNISGWTVDKKMKLNEDKTKLMNPSYLGL